MSLNSIATACSADWYINEIGLIMSADPHRKIVIVENENDFKFVKNLFDKGVFVLTTLGGLNIFEKVIDYFKNIISVIKIDILPNGKFILPNNLIENVVSDMDAKLSAIIRSDVIELEASDVSMSRGLGYSYSVSDVTEAFKKAIQNDCENAKEQGLQVAKYDIDNRRAYIEMPDGARKYVNA